MKKTIVWFGFILIVMGQMVEASGKYKVIGGVKTWVGSAKGQVTVKVIDDERYPVTNALVKAGFFNVKHEDARKVSKGFTSTNGLFTVKGVTTMDVNLSVTKAGYYNSYTPYSFRKSAPKGEKAVAAGRWQPWNPTVEVVLREIKNPIPMYAKIVEKKIPVEDTNLGFDLQQGDWVQPHGKGRMSDLIFKFTRRNTSRSDYEGSALLVFTNKFDGIVKINNIENQSDFKLPRYAPEAGYEKEYIYTHGKSPDQGYFGTCKYTDKKYYFFRVRSVVDKEDNLKEALYGKISNHIVFAGVGTDNFRVKFTYYLNPTPNDRNLEFDPKKNLFKNLTGFEKISAP